MNKKIKEKDSREESNAGDSSSLKARRLSGYLHVAGLLFGLTLLFILVRAVGLDPIFSALRNVGTGFFLLISIIGFRHVARTLAMRTAFAGERHRFTFRQAFAARLGGEAVTFLTFTGPVLGEATKAALLKRRVPLASGVQALLIDNLLYNLSVALFIASGACVMLLTYDLPDAARYPVLGIAVGMLLALVLVSAAVVRRMTPATNFVDALIRIGFKRRALLKRRERIRHVESNVYDFFRQHPAAFFGVVAFNILSHVTSVAEVWVALYLLGFDTRADVPYIIESLTKIINLVFGFVPATIGVYEGGTGLILNTLGFTYATGIALGIVRKAGTLTWVSFGLLTLMSRAGSSAARRLVRRYSGLQIFMDNLVLSNITHRPARTFVSVLGVAVGVLLIVFTVGLANGVLRERGRREAGVGAEIMLRATGTMGLSGAQPFGIEATRAEEIARVEGVREAVAVGLNTVESDRGFGMRVIDGVPFEQYARLSGLRMIEGRGFSESGDEAIIDSHWKGERNAKVGDTVRLYAREFTIVGVYEPPGGGRIKIPLRTMQEQVGAEGRATSILVGVNDPTKQEEVAARIAQTFPDEFQIIFMRDLPELYTTSVPALNVFISVIVGVAAAISMLVILLAMYTTVTERTRQIGILKSLGMSNVKIAWVIEQEALIVSVLGVALGVLLTLGARALVMGTTSLTVDIEPRWLLIALGIGLAGGTIGALYPAIRAARQDAVEALSYE